MKKSTLYFEPILWECLFEMLIRITGLARIRTRANHHWQQDIFSWESFYFLFRWLLWCLEWMKLLQPLQEECHKDDTISECTSILIVKPETFSFLKLLMFGKVKKFNKWKSTLYKYLLIYDVFVYHAISSSKEYCYFRVFFFCNVSAQTTLSWLLKFKCANSKSSSKYLTIHGFI